MRDDDYNRLQPLIEYCKSPDNFYNTAMDSVNKNQIRLTLVRSLAITDRLNHLIEDLPPELPVIPLKGMHLIKSVYPSGVRPLGDIDLLVKLKDLPIIEKVLRDHDYRPWYKGVPRQIHLRLAGKIAYTRTSNDVNFDIHWQLGPYPFLGRVSVDALWENAVFWEEGKSLKKLKDEHLLIHLCLHLFQHVHENWMVSCCDIAALIHHNNNALDWDIFTSLVKSWGVSLPVLYSLHKSIKLFDSQVPASVINYLQTTPVSPREQAIYANWLRMNTSWQRYLIEVRTTPNWLKSIFKHD